MKDEEPNMKLVAVYLVQDPRARLADLKKSKTFRNSRGELREWNDKSYQLVLPSLGLVSATWHVNRIGQLLCLASSPPPSP